MRLELAGAARVLFVTASVLGSACGKAGTRDLLDGSLPASSVDASDGADAQPSDAVDSGVGSDAGRQDGGEAVVCPPGRRLTDAPDDLSSPQIHVVYAVPVDGEDEALDTSGILAGSVASWSAWLERESGARLRLDTCGGVLDVTFLRMRQTGAELESRGLFLREALELELRATRVVPSHKLYAVFYGGPTSAACGGAPIPPQLVGQVAGLYFNGTVPGTLPCRSGGFAGAREPPRYLELATLHELVHALGLVPRCAPNEALQGHTSDDPTDLMYAGSEAWRPSVLDPGRDDYFLHGRSDCPDLAHSAFLDPSEPGAELPPGWPPGG